jgi:hypothetical protein
MWRKPCQQGYRSSQSNAEFYINATVAGLQGHDLLWSFAAIKHAKLVALSARTSEKVHEASFKVSELTVKAKCHIIAKRHKCQRYK